MASFIMSVLAALYGTVLRTLVHPSRRWLGCLRHLESARPLFVPGGVHWREGFSSVIPWSHPDYPLLVPAAIAHV
jgi:hypothetical protein